MILPIGFSDHSTKIALGQITTSLLISTFDLSIEQGRASNCQLVSSECTWTSKATPQASVVCTETEYSKLWSGTMDKPQCGSNGVKYLLIGYFIQENVCWTTVAPHYSKLQHQSERTLPGGKSVSEWTILCTISCQQWKGTMRVEQ